MNSDSGKRSYWGMFSNYYLRVVNSGASEATGLPPSFTRSLVINVVGLVIILGCVLLVILTWHGVTSTDKAARQEVSNALTQATSRLNILMLAAEMTASSAERVAQSFSVNENTVRPILENSLAALEQRPELSYLGLVLAATGEYVNIERTAGGDIFLWHFPPQISTEQYVQTFRLERNGFNPHQSLPTKGYDPRTRPFYQAALSAKSEGTWIPAYQWIEHARQENPLWGLSYVKALRDESGAVTGVLDADFDLPALNRFLKALSAEYNTRLYIIEMGATPRMIGGPEIDRAPQELPPEFSAITTFSEDTHVTHMSLDGEKQWVAARRLQLTGGNAWIVVSSKITPVIESSLQRQLWQILAMGAAIVIALVLVSLRLAYRFGKPLEELESQLTNNGQPSPGIFPAKTTSACKGFRETQKLRMALEGMAEAMHQQVLAQEQQLASAKLKSAIFDFTSAIIFSLDHNLRVIEWNTSAESVFGIQWEDVFGKWIGDIVKTPDASVEWTDILSAPDNAVYQFTSVKGIFDAELKVMHFHQAGHEVYTFILNDITESKRLEQKLRQDLNYADAVLNSLPGVFYHYDESLRLLRWNNNFEQISGYSQSELAGADPMMFFAEEDKTLVQSRIVEVMEKGESSVEVDYLLRDGRRIPYFFTGVRFEHAGSQGFVGVGTDITERRQAEQRIRYLALYDALTGLPNRNQIEESIQQAISMTRLSERSFALLYIDLERFKIVNGGYGHLFGNAVLKAVGEQLVNLVHADDVVARLGGDEYLILIQNTRQPLDATSIAASILEHFSPPIQVQHQDIHLSINIGISIYHTESETVDSLIDNAEIAMYKAKELGNNTFQLYSPDMGLKTQHRIDLEIKLRSAIAENQLHLVYQPKVNLKTGEISGCEALIRWTQPELGMVSPMDFIPIAEDSGLIVGIGDWVLRTACLQGSAWIAAGLPPICIAVNISVRQFLQQDMVTWVARTLHETGLPPECLELELTESLIAQDVESVTDTINQLKEIGVKLSIDDFGTGYSSLSYLKSFRVDTLKIDQSFVRNMLTETEDATIVLAVIALAHSLKFKVIAEGVETEQHCKYLQLHGCDEMQGYYFSKPIVATEFVSLVQSGHKLNIAASQEDLTS
ncbi:MAG TPA: EAL domain-containing protein [Methylophilus sp.]|uniref:bifunctional diguanylate cyclase/phosphodiesterase n=1 Tax=Methylophilus sp. TaxID=29541 RepID=UPI002CF46F3A|nr:EAL domain-containing protein [Methylophilus sp.]HSH87676.1 EAL domain-containing protein [Methylophilus sp.]